MKQLAASLLVAIAVMAAAAAAFGDALPAAAGTEARAQATKHDGAVFVAYFWRAKPGQADAYTEYIRKTAEPIDEDARRAGAFEEVRTVTPAPGVAADWTHLRVFRVKSMAAADALAAALDAATTRVVPDEAVRKANSERSAGLRDFVRREVWTEIR